MAFSALLCAVFLLVLFQPYCEGFDFTFESNLSTSMAAKDARESCAVLRCSEKLATRLSTSDEQRKVRALFTYRKQAHLGLATGKWELIASVTTSSPAQNQVSDGLTVNGKLLEKEANLTLELFKDRDCRFTEFACFAELEDSEGRKSVKRSLAGNDVVSESFDNFKFEAARLPTVGVASPAGKQPESPGVMPQLVTSLNLKLDLMQSTLADSLRVLENRLEDKVSSLQASVSDKMIELKSNVGDKVRESESKVFDKITQLENRLEDKLALLDTRSSAVPIRGAGSSENSVNAKINKDIAYHLAALGNSVRVIEENFTYIGDVMSKVEEVAGQCTTSPAGEKKGSGNSASEVTSLKSLTQHLITRFNAFRDSYAGGALVEVDDYFDPLGTGKKEWKLVFRGTPYINVKIYPAYKHGTGIPREVEKGCKQFNSSLPCGNHYRNHLALANWAGIYEVLFAIYKNDRVVKYVIFNARNSAYTDWFAASRVLASSWDDLTAKPHNIFSIEGETSPTYLRRFFMNFDYNNGCDGFRGWFYAADALPGGCASDKTLAHPKFLFASGKTFAVWTSPQAELADAIGVFLKYE
ncbi:hypothetical protein ElyMa_004706900 [Elysia marginata]|uniref:Fibrinogen C-terminal domain-containing protein n=1 Tax=Elysia marginata TaxID=1093978 RepID=A0AAV4I829_9GAST|nr:hypothetical protein ElyMa_004706900 [Elysia marginata]